MSRLESLPPGLLDVHVCGFLDAPSLGRLRLVNRFFQSEQVQLDDLWRQHVTREFGLRPLVPEPRSSRRICWRDVYQAAWRDARCLSSAAGDADVLKVFKSHPDVLLSAGETQLRNELVLMTGLRRFPLSASLIGHYAQLLRQQGAMPWLATR
ncbi:hypothetical protein ATCC90586_002328 [Pythium insidiosum]|nr:hypothetical protein ATCC90586_002328 [Pythium insidiosum]